MIILPIKAIGAWLLVHDDTKKNITHYIDIESSISSKYKIKVWAMEDFKVLQSVRDFQYSSLKSLVEYDCKSKSMRIIAYSLYEKNMAKGRTVFSKGRPLDWSNVNSSTINEAFMILGCDALIANQ